MKRALYKSTRELPLIVVASVVSNVAKPKISVFRARMGKGKKKAGSVVIKSGVVW